jgi:CheY-like chemotaxis protein
MKEISILIVEDNPIMASTLSNYLKKLGHKPLKMVDNGLEAILNAQQLKPELILMDINLEGSIDGIETAVEIKKKSNIPLIFITEIQDKVIFSKALDSVPFGFLYKPVSMTDLRSTIESAMMMHSKQIETENVLKSLELIKEINQKYNN